MNELDTNDLFKVSDLYFSKKYMMFRHLINSYDKFIEEDIFKFLLTKHKSHIFHETISQNKIIRHRIVYNNIAIEPPTLGNEIELLSPKDARQKSYTYSLKILADVYQEQEIIDIQSYSANISNGIVVRQIGEKINQLPIANIPLMIRSKYCNLHKLVGNEEHSECEYDPGGYFIVNGAEKVIVSQDRIVENKPLIFVKKDQNTIIYTVQINSRTYDPFFQNQLLILKMKKNGIITYQNPIFNEINVFILLRILGIETDKDIIKYTVYDLDDVYAISIIKKSLDECVNDKGVKIVTKVDALDYLITKLKIINKLYTETNETIKYEQKKRHILDLLTNNFLPHIKGGLLYKAYYLGYAINKLLKVYIGKLAPDDRDSYINKRVELAGDLLYELFRNGYKKVINECNKFFISRNETEDNPINVLHQLKPTIIEQGLKKALSTGDWGKRKGVAQMQQRLTYLQSISFLRRVDAPNSDAGAKLTSPGQLHPSSVGFLCPIQTPEHGTGVGMKKHFNIITSVTIMENDIYELLLKIVKSKIQKIEEIAFENFKYTYKVFVNGEWIGMATDINKIYKELVEMKNNGKMGNKTTSIIRDPINYELKIYCDGGRMYRPIICVENNKLLLDKTHIKAITSKKIKSWEEFMRTFDVIQYMDVESQPYMMIADMNYTVKLMHDRMISNAKYKLDTTTHRYDDAQFVRYSHCEIHPSLLLGEVAVGIPFAHHNPGTRNIYQYAQGRQGIGIYNTKYRHRLDISAVLYNPQRPLVTTKAAKYTNVEVLPPGENVVVAIATYTGYNQEDSLIISSDAIQKGLFRTMSLKKYVSKIEKNQSTSQDDIFMKPDINKISNMKSGSYDKLNEHGYVNPETVIYNTDIIMGKVTPIQHLETDPNRQYKDSSEVYKSHAPGTVDKVYIGLTDQDGYETRKMLIRSERIPTIGDKFCCYDKNTEILTTKGWILFEELDITHEVATLIFDENNNGKLIYIKPTEVQSYDYNGELIHFMSEYVNVMVTPNHRMWIQENGNEFKIVTAENCFENATFQHTAFYEGNNTITAIMEELLDIKVFPFEIINAFCVLFGIWMINLYTQNNGSQGFIKNKLTLMELDSACNKLKLSVTKNEENATYNITNDKLDKYFKSLTVLPEWLWSLNTYHMKALLYGFLVVNSRNRTMEFITINQNLSQDVQRMCVHAEYNTQIIGKNLVKIKINKTVTSNVTLENINRIDYLGKVYCCTVPTIEGLVYVRRNKNNGVWCGNSKHGQKGTIGLVIDGNDMPFTSEGIRPDIIMNPNAVPSRMTIGQLIECIVGKIGAIKGYDVDATPFEQYDIEKFKIILEELGYNGTGTEYLYNGMTGEKIEVQIFIGPTYYQRLKHLVTDKIHSRSKGPTTMLTRQPPEGRSRDGGSRLGEMEKDAIVAHGMSKFLLEKMLYNSDAFGTYVCNKCGLLAQRSVRRTSKPYAMNDDIYYCKVCDNYNEISLVIIPYAFKLLIQELMSMCIVPRLMTNA